MLLIGALRRDAGKTEFACALIKALCRRGFEVVGAKVTTMRPEDHAFHFDVPRRKDLLSGKAKYVLLEEKRRCAKSDTARMLLAGAKRSFWVVASSAHLEEAAQALLAKARPTDIVVCESNSLRLVVAPKRFLVVDREGPGEESGKRSLTEALRFPHEVIRLEEDGAQLRESAALAAGIFSASP
ncbi:MAG: hypothetical protein HY922_05015 [Elusimicrobia bacterium]|nr:hypothetical protein [Elusimicrobiota bacterium]